MIGSINTQGVSYKRLLEILKGIVPGVDVIATKLKNARKISITGDVNGSATFDGSDDVDIAVTLKKNAVITGTGAVSVALQEGREYSFTGVKSLSMPYAAVNAHGFISFGSSSPAVSIGGFTGSSGDDITKAAASETWEFSVYPHNGGSYIIWKNWSA